MEMTNVTIVHALDWATVRRPAAVLELVHEIQTSPPYCYGPDEAAPVARWFPALLNRVLEPTDTADWVVRTVQATSRPSISIAGTASLSSRASLSATTVGTRCFCFAEGGQLAAAVKADVHRHGREQVTECTGQSLVGSYWAALGMGD